MTGNKGYSVFEVLIAFAIMALVLSALLPGHARLLARASNSDEALLAHDFALSRLASIGVAQEIQPGESVFEDRDWRAIQLITRTEAVATGRETYEITVTIVDLRGRELARATAARSIAQ